MFDNGIFHQESAADRAYQEFCPLIFECARQWAWQTVAADGYRGKRDEDETFISPAYNGGNSEPGKNQKDKLAASLLSPQYYDLADIRWKRLREAFLDVGSGGQDSKLPSRRAFKQVRRGGTDYSTIAVEPKRGSRWQVNHFCTRDLAAIRKDCRNEVG